MDTASGRSGLTMGKNAQNRRKRAIPMVVIPEPAPGTRTVMVRTGEGTLVFDAPSGPATTLVCGKCRAPLVQGMRVDQIEGMVLRCNQCGAYNESLIS